MKDKYKFLPVDQRKKILLMCDDIRVHSGVANMAREIVLNTVHHFNWINVGATHNHPEHGKILDLSESVRSATGVKDAQVLVYPSNGYGTPNFLRSIISRENPDAIFIFTDPRYWTWLFEMEREIRSSISICYLNIWDNYPTPLYNKPYYESCDLLMAISKQTLNINKLVLAESSKHKVLKYIPHGVDPTIFYPIQSKLEEKSSLQEFRSMVFQDREFDFTILFNSRNIRRKQPGDVILAFKMFCDLVGDQQAKRCALILHTNPIEEAGTDLVATRDAFIPKDWNNVFFSTSKLSPSQMNLLYNLVDVNLLISSAEGWGLSVTEATMAGTMSVVNVTGGLQDQCRFEDLEGNWIDFDENFTSNHKGKYKKCGEWVVPVFPNSSTLVGSPATPYIFEDRVNPEEVAQALFNLFTTTTRQDRSKKAVTGREWMMGEEAGFTSEIMGNRVIDACDEVLQNFIPRPRFELVKVNQNQDNLNSNLSVYGPY